MRDNCIYCGETLIQSERGGLCPVHSKDFLAAINLIPEGYALVKKPELLGVGVPKREG